MFKKKNLKYLFTIMSLFLIALMIVFLVSPNLGKKTTQESLKQELIVNKGTYDESTIVLKDTNKSIATSLANRLNAKLRITKDGSFATLTLSDSTFLDVVSNPDNQDILDYFSVDYMSTVSDIEEVEEEYVKKPSKYVPSDEYYNAQSYLDYINLDNVWSSYRGWGVTVAIIDTGIDTDHPEFEGRISEYSYNATLDKIVKDYTDSEGNYDWSLIEDTQGHGTAVTGVIAATMDNGGIAGISPDVTILTIKVESDEYGNFYRTSDLVFGLYYAIERDVNVVNMSFGGGTNLYSDAARLAVDSDITLVAAAGNDATSSLTYPAADPNVIGVGALAEKSFELAQYSNYGENNDLVAPGTVYTTKNDGTFTTMNGTSFASPIVASVVALYNNYEYYPTVDAIKERLFASTIDLGALGKDYYYGYGALDVKAFILEPVSIVTFNYLTDEIDETKQIFINGHTLQSLPEPERLYSVFDGWYYDIDCTEELKYYEDIFSSDLTLYAKWANEDDSVPYTYVILDDNTVEIRSYTGHRRYITIPDYIDGKVVSSIGDEAFSSETRIREINLPRYLTNISRNAFYGCSNLLKINIPDTVTSIGNNAFKDCVRMQEVTFGEASILKQIGSYAFSNCSSLLRFDIPKSVETVDGATFMGTTSLREINAHKQSKVYKSVDGVLFNKTKSTLIAYPAGLKQGYLIPSSVTKLGVASFAYTKEETINLNNIKTIEDYAFSGSKLISIVIPDSVTYMGMGAFNLSTNLKTVTLSKNLNTISSFAFNSCYSLSEILIPNNIITIDSFAFGMSGLVNITFEENSKLLSIGEASFEKTLLNKIIIPKSVVQIGDSAFNYNVYLTSVLFEEGSSLYSIGSYAFNKNVNLTTINLPNNLGYIGSYAFMESKLTGSITLPASVEVIGDGAFASCHSLEYIFVDEENIVYKDINGVLYTVDNTMLVAYPSGNTSYNYIVENVKVIGAASFYGAKYLGEVTLPNTLEEIREYAFAYNTNLGYITIPQNVVQIGRFAFTNNYNLTSVYFDQNSVLPRISYASFANTGIYSITIPSSVSTIAQEAFIGSNNLTNVTFDENSNLDIISAYMFKGSNNIQSITFLNGSKLKSISAHGFEGMRNLQTVDFGDATVENIDNYAFRYCSSLSNIVIPSTVKYIGRYAFYGAKSLTRLDIPESVDYIGTNAFYMADNLDIYFKKNTLPTNLQYNWDNGIRGYYVGVKEVLENEEFRYAILNDNTISIIEYLGSNTSLDLTSISFDKDITQIGGYAFYRSNLTNVILPSTITMIGQYSFAYSKINSVTIPDNVKYIAKYAFYNSDITEVKISENSKLEKIEQHAFSLCDKLTNIYIPSSVKTLERGVFKESGLTNITFDSNINITTIPEEAFLGTKLVTVSIPNSVTLIDHNAFRDILNLQSVKFGTSNLQIMSNVFYNTGLTVVNIPANITYIGEYSFVGLRELKEFNVDENNTKYKDIDGVLFSKDGKKLIAYPASITGAYTVNKNVETIGFGAFENTSLSSVTFEEGINLLTIGYRAFFNAKKLTEVSVPASVVSIDYYAFAYCENLIKVTFAIDNRLTGIYEGAFYGCKSLKDIVLPDSIVEISDYSFSGCISLETLPISKNSSLKGIYSYAFAHSGLKEVTIPETVVDIESYAFKGVKITNLVIPSTNAKQLIIGIGAFEDCNYLESITLPFIGASYEDTNISWFGYIFGAGSYEANNTYVPESLKEVTIHEGIEEIGNGAFYGLQNIKRVNLPSTIKYIKTTSFTNTTFDYELKNQVSVNFLGHLGTGIKGRLDVVVESDFVNLFEYLNLETIIISNNVTDLDVGNAQIKNIYLPESLMTLFMAGDETINLYYPNSIENWCNLDITNWGKRYSLYLLDQNNQWYEPKEIVVPNSVKEIKQGTFTGMINLEKVSLHNEVTKIGGAAFARCQSLHTVSLSENLVEIGESAFAYSAIKHIVIYDKVTTIGESLFEHCIELETAVIKGNITLIPYRTFYHCFALREVTLPNSIEIISDGAFSSCHSLYRFDVPENTTFIDEYAFSYANNLKEIYNHSNLNLTLTTDINKQFDLCYYAQKIYNKDGSVQYKEEGVEYVKTEDNFVFKKDQNSNYYLIAYLGDKNFIQFPTTINNEKIDYSFSGGIFQGVDQGQDIKKISISDDTPNTLTYDVLKYLYNLEEIEVSSNNPNYYFSNGVLYKKQENGLEAIFILKNVKEFTFEENIIDFEPFIFEGLHNVEKIILPDIQKHVYITACLNLKYLYVSKEIFGITIATCPKLKEIDVDENNLSLFVNDSFICESIEGVLTLKSVLKNIESNVIIPDYIGAIASSAFEDCDTIKYVTIPSSITTIPVTAFMDCDNLETVNILGNLTSIEANAFRNCINLININVPDTVNYIGGGAFHNCSSLEYINIPQGIEILKSFTFSDCTNLLEVVLPSNLKQIEGYALDNNFNIKSITIPLSLKTIGLDAFFLPNLKSVYYEGTFEDWCKIENEVTNGIIWADEFYTKNQNGEYELITDFVVPESITSIPKMRFKAFKQFKTLTLHNNIDKIEYGAFSGVECDEVYFDGTIEEWFNIDFDGYSSPVAYSKKFYVKNDLNEYELVQNLIIPEGVQKIPEYMFAEYHTLLTVSFPSTLEEIGDRAFSGCYNLKEVHNNSNLNISFIDINANLDGNSLTHAEILYDKDGNKFYRDEETIIIDTVDMFKFMYKNSEYRLINYFGNNSEIVLPENINGFKYRISMQYNYNVEKIIIPNSITEINSDAFYGCKNLQSVYISASVISIGQASFGDCVKLKDIIFEKPQNITSIGYCAFENTYVYNDSSNWENGLLYIGTCLVAIDEKAKENLTQIIVRENTSAIESTIFINCFNVKYLKTNLVNNVDYSDFTNLETLEIGASNLINNSILQMFNYEIPLTLRNIIIESDASVESDISFSGVEKVNIYVDEYKENVMWDHDYPNWNNGNKVFYKGEWITSEFYDINNELIEEEYYSVNQIIRQPFVKNINDGIYLYEFIGWDLNNDGIVDTIPATSTVDICAKAIYEKTINKYQVNFIDKDGTTILFSYEVDHGNIITLPDVPTKKGYTFISWEGYTEGMVAIEDINIYSTWLHNDSGHNYSVVETVDPTCEEQGYIKHICSICDEWYGTDFVEALGHNYVENIISPTCEEQGYTKHTCSVCDDTYNDNYMEKLDHSFGEWIIDQNATCEEDGLKHRICSSCDYNEEIVIDAFGHNYVIERLSSSTCTSNGYDKYTCTNCNEEVILELPLEAHNYVEKYASKTIIQTLLEFVLNIFFGYKGDKAYYYECQVCKHILLDNEQSSSSVQGTCTHEICVWNEDVEASCDEVGFMLNTCTSCNQVINVKTIEALGHSYSSEVIEPICDEQGYTIHICDRCNASYKDNYVDELGHNYSSVITNPTCESQGYTTHTCERCNDTYVDSYVDALGHDIVVDEKVEPTCTETGLTEGEHCTRCDYKVEQVVVDALGHSYSDEVTLPTCEAQGYITHTCDRCNDSYVDSYVDALGHNIVVDEKVEPTCTKDGLSEGSHCTRCDYKVEQTIIEALGHNYSSKITLPTCTTEGYTTHTCDRCNDTYIDSYVDELGHDIVVDEKVEPTCTETGLIEGEHCARCDYKVEQTVIEALGHNYSSEIILPTCTSQGYTTHTCDRCNDSYVDSYVDELGHDIVVDEKVEPTCTKDGLTEGEHCTRCDHKVEQVVIEALGHNYTSVVTLPTCESRGYTTHTCERCNDIYIDSYVDALGHDIVVDERVEPTCTETGLTEGEHCTRCDHKVAQEVVEALGHNYSSEITLPTCTTEGYTTHTCERCNDTYVDSYVDALGHDIVVDERVEPTCTKDGLSEGSHCTRCDYKVVQEIINALGHNYNSVVIEPTCETQGYTAHTCERCNDTYVDSYVEASGHELIVDKGYDATCTEAGLTDGSHCAKCDYKVEQVKIDPKGHIESDWIIDKEATTESDGIKHKECTVCGDELIKGTINKLPSSNNCNMSKVYIMNLISMFNLFALAILIFRKRR